MLLSAHQLRVQNVCLAGPIFPWSVEGAVKHILFYSGALPPSAALPSAGNAPPTDSNTHRLYPTWLRCILGGGWYFLHGHKPEATIQIYKETVSSYPGDFFFSLTLKVQDTGTGSISNRNWVCVGWTALKWQTQETVGSFSLLSLCLRNGVMARTVQRNWRRQEPQEDLVWVCVELRRILDLNAWRWAEEKQSRLFQQTGIQAGGVGGGEGRQAAQGKEEVNKRVLKEVLPIHCIKKFFRSFLDFHFLPSYCKVGVHIASKRSCRPGSCD